MVTIQDGKQIDFDAAVELMDDDIREELHAKLAPCSDQAFLDAYEAHHNAQTAKFGCEFIVN